jgi:hypothetical protein
MELMSHTDAALTPHHPLTVAQFVVDESWPVSAVAGRFHGSWTTVEPSVNRYRASGSVRDRTPHGLTARQSEPTRRPHNAAPVCAFDGASVLCSSPTA